MLYLKRTLYKSKLLAKNITIVAVNLLRTLELYFHSSPPTQSCDFLTAQLYVLT